MQVMLSLNCHAGCTITAHTVVLRTARLKIKINEKSVELFKLTCRRFLFPHNILFRVPSILADTVTVILYDDDMNNMV